ncbi:hypothetical protein [Cyanobium sp. CH-040]|uniref:hypothetical protein n=1 Tax=Cyanobium sp. CH-040 TaxID=2823708 RepID=UPI0020CBCF3B|nr:hypothetical protein [Cyanobium sp. CH-040]
MPQALVELYGLLAVLVVLMPEWIADGALWGWRMQRRGVDLALVRTDWHELPELRLAAMGLAELRLLAHDLRLPGYACESRERLNRRLLRRLQRRGAGRKAL